MDPIWVSRAVYTLPKLWAAWRFTCLYLQLLHWVLTRFWILLVPWEGREQKTGLLFLCRAISAISLCSDFKDKSFSRGLCLDQQMSMSHRTIYICDSFNTFRPKGGGSGWNLAWGSLQFNPLVQPGCWEWCQHPHTRTSSPSTKRRLPQKRALVRKHSNVSNNVHGQLAERCSLAAFPSPMGFRSRRSMLKKTDSLKFKDSPWHNVLFLICHPVLSSLWKFDMRRQRTMIVPT